MNYYVIYVCEEDSVRIEPTFIDGLNPLGEEWDAGKKLEVPKGIQFDTYLPKRNFYDWVGGYSWNPYVGENVKNRLEPLLGKLVQWVGPIQCKSKTYFMLNCINVVDCLLPESNSNKIFFRNAGLREQWLFRPKPFVRQLIATESLRDDVLKAGDSGVRCGLIRQDGWITSFHNSQQ